MLFKLRACGKTVEIRFRVVLFAATMRVWVLSTTSAPFAIFTCEFSHSKRLAAQFPRQIIIASVFHLAPRFYIFLFIFSLLSFRRRARAFPQKGAGRERGRVFPRIPNCIITSRTLLRLGRFSLFAPCVFGEGLYLNVYLFGFMGIVFFFFFIANRQREREMIAPSSRLDSSPTFPIHSLSMSRQYLCITYVPFCNGAIIASVKYRVINR